MIRSERFDAEFCEFVAAHESRLFRKAYLLTTSQHQAEDLLQTALAKAYAAWWRVRRADDPLAYVHGIVAKAFLSERRKRSNGELPMAEPPEASSHLLDATDRLVLLQALSTLEPVDRAVVVLRYWEDRSVEQTASALGLTQAAVKNRSLRALKRLRAELGTNLSDYPMGSIQ